MEISRDVPQSILDEMNEVDWSAMPATGRGSIKSVVGLLSKAPTFLRLPLKRRGQDVFGAGGQRIMPDVPQDVLDVLSLVDWSRMEGDEIRRLRKQLGGQIAAKKLPYRR